jgi:hypothetical protein
MRSNTPDGEQTVGLSEASQFSGQREKSDGEW